jgi:rare lipoprotein A
MAFQLTLNVNSERRIDIGIAVRTLIQSYRGSFTRLQPPLTLDQLRIYLSKARRGSSYVPSHFSWNYRLNPGRGLARSRPVVLFVRAPENTVTNKIWQFNVRGALMLLSLSLAVSCATQQSPQASAPITASPESAPSTPVAQHVRPHPSNTTRASYLADAYDGRRTASGERYNPNALTAASSKLPIGSTVMVTNPSTGRSVKVRINDRAPNVRGRSLDLSKRAAEEIGITKQGVAKVNVRHVESKPEPSEGSSSSAPPNS